jgi:hypothetical protein
VPPVDAVRPARCVRCGTPGAPSGEPKRVHGHGLRTRLCLGALALGDSPAIHTLVLRRYRCQRCEAVMLACPRGVLGRLRYGVLAVVLALALWAAEGEPGHVVRSAVSPWRSTGDERFHGWRSLSRWAQQPALVGCRSRSPPASSAREIALDTVRQLSTRVLVPTGSLALDACAAALNS